jgi:hypothetical protein
VLTIDQLRAISRESPELELRPHRLCSGRAVPSIEGNDIQTVLADIVGVELDAGFGVDLPNLIRRSRQIDFLASDRVIVYWQDVDWVDEETNEMKT